MGRLERPYRHQFALAIFKQGQSDIGKGLFNSNPIGEKHTAQLKTTTVKKGSLVFFVFFGGEEFSATLKADGST